MRKRRITSQFSYIRHQIVDRLQGIYLSKKFSSYIPVSTNEDGGNGNGTGSLHPSGRIPLFKGIDRVVSGAQPAAEAVVICGIKPYRYFWYMLSGSKSAVICDIDLDLLISCIEKLPSPLHPLMYSRVSTSKQINYSVL